MLRCHVRPGIMVVSLALTSIGCSGGDRFKPGSEAMLVAGEKSPGVMMKTEKGRGSIGGDLENVDPGTKVRIIEDSGVAPKNDPGGRRIRIMLLDGPHAGLPGIVSQADLSRIQ